MTKYNLEPNADAKEVPKRVALVRKGSAARLLRKKEEHVMAAPHLLLREIILIQVVVGVFALISLFFDAPLEGIADPEHTPNPAKAPWYFLGLQELLHYFPPVVAGVILPASVVIFIAIVPYVRVNLEVVGLYEGRWKRSLIIISAIVVPSSVLLFIFHAWPILVPTVILYLLLLLPLSRLCPETIRMTLFRITLAEWIMTWFVIVATILTVIGVWFRGPGWSWAWPWQGGHF
jgi:hypothetical protein